MDSTDSEGHEAIQEKIKVPKHLIEKKRRARINNCLGELKKLVIEKNFLKGQRSSKLEKADILELTVEYLKRKAKLPYPVRETTDTSELQTKLYERGYRECLNQVSRHLKSMEIEQSVGNALLAELETMAQKTIAMDSKKTGKHLELANSGGKSRTGSQCKSSLPDVSYPSLDSVATEEEPKSNQKANGTAEHIRVSPKTNQELNQERKRQIESSNTFNSINLERNKMSMFSSSAKMTTEQTSGVHVGSDNVSPMYPVMSSLQSVTVLVPCQVLTSSIAPVNMSQYQPSGHSCEHPQIGGSLINHQGYSNVLDTNPSYIRFDTVKNVLNANSRDTLGSTAVSGYPKQGEYGCLSPWRPW
ncbi:hairy/enhancer-of-split related with YRPW motif protein-like [Ylistrum balloti]|uniref:hairy/enhancer-of-split related with YRPW motif protein-like n=1 Tax=Ylistrum balloti TaxID=509963 RepID=UPI0029057FEC|nr:hairy/enhancer-of-split related with YRPW motif protein-like [Ylistrum balloti]